MMTGIVSHRAYAGNVDVGGVGVGTSNADNVTSPAIVSGKVSYNLETNTLVLNNVTIDASKVSSGFKRGIQINSVDKCSRVVLIGDNKIYFSTTPSSDDSPICFYTNHSVEIIGNGTLRTEGGKYGMYVGNGATLTIAKTTLYVADTDLGIVSSESSIVFTDANVFYTSKTSNGQFVSSSSVTMNDVKVTWPSSVTFNSSKYGFVRDGSLYKGSLNLTRTTTTYPFVINNIRLTSYDIAYPTKYVAKKGTITVSDNDLNFNNVTIENTMYGEDGITYVGTDKIMYLNLTGVSRIEGFRTPINMGLLNTLSLNSKTDGRLVIHGTGSGYGIVMADNKDVYINNCQLFIENVAYGISGNSTGNGLYIKNGTLDIQSSSICVTNIHNCVLDGVGVKQPAGATYSSEKKTFVDTNGKSIEGYLWIKPCTFYDVQVGGIAVTDLNCDDVLGDGTVRYDLDWNCLYLNNANIPTYGIYVGTNAKAAMKISVTGNNVVDGGNVAGAGLNINNNHLTLTGKGTVTFQNAKNWGMIINGGSLSIRGAMAADAGPSVYVTQKGSTNIGIYGYTGAEKLTVEKSYLNVFCEGVVVDNLTSLSTIWNPITHPVGSYFDESKKQLCYYNGAVVSNDRFVIEEVDDYGIDVANIRIHSKNCDNVQGPGISGSVSYDRATNTLFLKNATIKSNDWWGIMARDYDQGKGFNMHVEGTNEVYAKTQNAISIVNTWGGNSTLISGGGSLKVTSDGDDAIYYSTDLTVDDVDMVVKSGAGYALNANGCPLTVVNAEMDMTGSSVAITNLGELTMDRSEITQPHNGYFEFSKGGVVDPNGNLVSKVVISRKTEDKYGLVVGGVEVTSTNADNITSPYISGSVYFIPASWTLVLTDATISDKGIFASKDGYYKYAGPELHVQLYGNNSVAATTDYPFYLEVPTYIHGPGTLTADTDDPYADILMLDGSDLTINEWCTVNVGGISGSGSGKLIVDNATIHGTDQLTGFDDLVMTNVDVIVPNSVYYDTTKKQLPDMYGNAAIGYEIGKVDYYGIWVGDVQANSVNCANITGEKIAGKVSYEHGTHTLTFEDAMLTMNSQPIKISPDSYIHMKSAIYDGSDLTVELKGESKCTMGDVIDTPVNTTFCGDGTLTLNAIELGSGANLTYAGNCTVNGSSIFGSGNNTVSVIDNATVNLKGQISSITQLVFGEGLGIVKPEGAYFDPAAGKVVDAEGNTATGITLGLKTTVDYGLIVGGVAVTSDNAAAITGTSITGNVSFDPATGILTLDNATITGKGIEAMKEGARIYTGVGLEIELKGNNTIVVAAPDYSVNTQVYTRFFGTGTLTADADGDAADINVTNGCILTITDCTLNVGTITGSTLGMIIIDHGTLNGTGTVTGFDSMAFIDTDVIVPNSAIYDNTNKWLSDAEGNAAKGYEIGKVDYYGIWVADVQANSVNSSAITGSKISGTATYDPATHTLTLDGVTLAANSPVIRVAPEDLTHQKTAAFDGSSITVVLKGENKLNTGLPYSAKTDTHFKGDGAIMLNAIELAGGVNLTLTDEAKVSANEVRGGAANTVTVDNATLSLADNFFNIADLVLGERTRIVTPVKGVFDKDGGYVKDGEARAVGVLIRQLTDEEWAGISDIMVDGAAVSTVYNTQGVRTDRLQKGVNIIRLENGKTRKLMKK